MLPQRRGRCPAQVAADNRAHAPALPMTGLFIIAHAPLASALRAAAMHAYPEAAASVLAYDVPAGADVDTYRHDAGQLLDSLGTEPTLIITDVFGATPCNVARLLADRPVTRAVAGASLPMLWRVLNYRDRSLDELVTIALAGATQGAMQVTANRPQNQAQKLPSHDPIDRHHQQ